MRTELRTPQVQVTPGDTTFLEVHVANTTEVIDGVTVVVEGLDPAWVHLPVPVLSLFPEDSATFTVRVDLPRNCPAGEYLVILRVVSLVDPTRQTVHETWLTVAPAPAGSLRLRPSLVTGGRTAELEALIDNLGNCPLELALAAVDPTRVLACDVQAGSVAVPVGHTARVLVRAKGPRPWFGQTVARSITVTAAAPPVEFQEVATFNQKPRVARGVLTALILAGIVALWATIFLLVVDLLGRQPDPTKAVADNFNTGGTRDVQLTDVAGSVEGRIAAGTTGEGLARITIEAYRVLPDGTLKLSASAATDEDGSYALASLLPGTYKMRLSADGFDPVWYPGAATPEEAEALDVQPQAPLATGPVPMVGQPGALLATITVSDAAATPPTFTVTVTQRPEPGQGVTAAAPLPPPTVVQTAGELALGGLATPATYGIRVESPGFEAQDLEATLAGGETRVLNTITLVAARGSISGRVTDAAGNPLGDVTVAVRAGDFEVETKTPTVGNPGTFVVDRLETPRTYVLTFTRPGFSSPTVALDLAAGENRQAVTATLVGGTGTVTGTARDGNGAPLGGVTVTIARGTYTATTTTLTTGDVGRYSFAGVPTPGTFSVTFSRAGLSSETRQVSFTDPGRADGIDAVLRPATARLSGTVRRGGAPVQGITVSLDDGRAARTTASASIPAGAYSFADVAPGSYTITFTVPGTPALRQVLLVNVAEGADAVYDVDLPA